MSDIFVTHSYLALRLTKMSHRAPACTKLTTYPVSPIPSAYPNHLPQPYHTHLPKCTNWLVHSSYLRAKSKQESFSSGRQGGVEAFFGSGLACSLFHPSNFTKLFQNQTQPLHYYPSYLPTNISYIIYPYLGIKEILLCPHPPQPLQNLAPSPC